MRVSSGLAATVEFISVEWKLCILSTHFARSSLQQTGRLMRHVLTIAVYCLVCVIWTRYAPVRWISSPSGLPDPSYSNQPISQPLVTCIVSRLWRVKRSDWSFLGMYRRYLSSEHGPLSQTSNLCPPEVSVIERLWRFCDSCLHWPRR